MAYLALLNGTATTQLTASDLRLALAETLPSYMVPSEIVFLARLPVTSTGKIDLRALPAPTTPPARTLSKDEEPGSELERKLLGHWEQIFQRRPLGRHDNFSIWADTRCSRPASLPSRPVILGAAYPPPGYCRPPRWLGS